MTHVNSPDDFRRAAKLLESGGWARTPLDQNGSHCVLSAIAVIRTMLPDEWRSAATLTELRAMVTVIREVDSDKKLWEPSPRLSPHLPPSISEWVVLVSQVASWNDQHCDGTIKARTVLEKTAARLEEIVED